MVHHVHPTVLVGLFIALTSANYTKDLSAQQLIDFKRQTSGPIGTITLSTGAPVELRATSTINTNLIANEFFLDTMLHLSRERIPERVVHALGAGAFGYFEVTHDRTDICKAKLFNTVGKITPVAVRFSLFSPSKGAADTTSDVRGFAVKFYTEDGNYDIVGLNIPAFVIKDPILFPSFVHSRKPNPATNFVDIDMEMDFTTIRTEGVYAELYLSSGYGTPDGYRHMPGFGIHTFQVVNDKNESYFVRYYFEPDAGIKNLAADEATNLSGSNPSYSAKDLYNAIARGDFPSWTVYLQILTLEDVKKASLNVFDPTKVLPTDMYPLQPLGRIVLNRNPVNYFADIEQLAFSPGNVVPGVLGSPDKLYQGRRLSYRDAHNYRLGGNVNNIKVNCPLNGDLNYLRDGFAPVLGNGGNVPNYYPNSYNGPVPYIDSSPEIIEITEDETVTFDQAEDFYLNFLTESERQTLVTNFIQSLNGVEEILQDRLIKILTEVNPNLGAQVKEGLQKNENSS